MTLKRVTRGERLRIPAESWNALMDVAEAHRADRFSLGMERQAARQRAGIITVRNDTGAALDRFAVVGLDDPLIDPADNEDAFLERPALAAVEPDEAIHHLRVAICQTPLAADGVGPAMVAGITPAMLDVQSEDDGFAAPVTGTTTSLTTGSSGSIRILWKAPGTGAQWGLVMMPVGGSDPNLIVIVAQGGHGFSPGTVVRFDGSGWATASPPDVVALGNQAKVGLVWSVADAGTFSVLVWGRVQLGPGAPVTVAANRSYFLAAGGGMTSAIPTDQDEVVELMRTYRDSWTIWQPQAWKKIEICEDGIPSDYLIPMWKVV